MNSILIMVTALVLTDLSVYRAITADHIERNLCYFEESAWHGVERYDSQRGAAVRARHSTGQLASCGGGLEVSW